MQLQVQCQEHPITLVEDTAAVKKVAARISSEAFEGAPVVLLNSKNLPIPDVEGTQGGSNHSDFSQIALHLHSEKAS